MSRNIKEIGKELMGKSLNSFHRKTGLTQLEKNNEMQDGILDGILSQVDDAYIEKTEQSNVIHLDGSGDGVVVVDGIEGNTMVNEINSESLRNWTYSNNTYTGQYANTQEFGIDWSKEVQFNCWLQAKNNSNPIFTKIKPNTDYTVWINILENNPTLDGVSVTNCIGSLQLWINGYNSIRRDLPVNTKGWVSFNYNFNQINTSVNYSMFGLSISGTNQDGTKIINGGKLRISKEVIVLEGLNTPLNKYFEGLQSSFEEKVNDEGKYEIEILSNNKNLVIEKDAYSDRNDTTCSWVDGKVVVKGSWFGLIPIKKLKLGKVYTLSFNKNIINSTYPTIGLYNGKDVICPNTSTNKTTVTIPYESDWKIIVYCSDGKADKEVHYNNIQLEENTNISKYVPHKQNKIKLLINEPLRNKDKLCIKDGKIVVERNSKQSLLDGNLNWTINNSDNEGIYSISTTDLVGVPKGFIISDKLPTTTTTKNEGVMLGVTTGKVMVCIDRNKLTNTTLNGMKQYLNENPMQVVFDIETYYEEVLNEYGEPILLEGYENGTIYIDSTIVPTTTVRYTPKMESFKTLNEVSNNNTMLTNDINDNIIPYMMDVDLMIMEKEMALMSQYKTRTIGVKDMTSMQKRTQDMLERLIKGKTLTEQECKTRVTTYLNAGKITDAQAEELNFLIDEIYA